MQENQQPKSEHKFITKIKIIWKIMTNQYPHFVLLSVDKQNLINLIQDKDVDVKIGYVGLRPYLFFKLIQESGKMKSDIDMILDKAQSKQMQLSTQQKQKINEKNNHRSFIGNSVIKLHRELL